MFVLGLVTLMEIDSTIDNGVKWRIYCKLIVLTFFPGIIQTTASQIYFLKMKINISIKKIKGNAMIM